MAGRSDWAGGTRLRACLREFNRAWSRRVLGQGAVMLLVTDGLDRDPEPGLAAEAERLHRSCRRLIWLNPLLRWEGFQPRAQGVERCCPTSTSTGRSTTWRAWRRWGGRCRVEFSLLSTYAGPMALSIKSP